MLDTVRVKKQPYEYSCDTCLGWSRMGRAATIIPGTILQLDTDFYCFGVRAPMAEWPHALCLPGISLDIEAKSCGRTAVRA